MVRDGPRGISDDSFTRAGHGNVVASKGDALQFGPGGGGGKSLVDSWIIAPTREHHKNNAACVTVWQTWLIALRRSAYVSRLHRQDCIDKSLRREISPSWKATCISRMKAQLWTGTRYGRCISGHARGGGPHGKHITTQNWQMQGVRTTE